MDVRSNILYPVPFPLDVVSVEEWRYGAPVAGDHIRVRRECLGCNVYNHHGIYVSEAEVIHFTGDDEDNVLDWSKCEVRKTDLEKFLKEGKLEVKVYLPEEENDLYPAPHIVAYARACLGDNGYHLIFNNCEHFANVCTLGRFRSRQVEKLLGGDFMSVWSWVKGLFSGNSSSNGGDRSTHAYNYNYEPDKVRVAEIERDMQLCLADKENERIELMKDARLEVLDREKDFSIAVEQAKALGFQCAAKALIELRSQLNELDNKRFALIEKGTLLAVKEVEQHYQMLSQEICEERQRYQLEKLPPLFTMLRQYNDDPVAYEMFHKSIDMDIQLQLESMARRIAAARDDERMLKESIYDTKKKIIEQTAAIEGRFAEGLACEYNQVNGRIAGAGMSSANGVELPGISVAGALPGGKMS